MRENATKTIEIEAVDDDLDDDTVMRFLEYIYTNDYAVPDPVVLQLPSDTKYVAEAFLLNKDGLTRSNEVQEPTIADDLERAVPTRKSKKDKKKRRSVWYEEEPIPVAVEESELEPEVAAEEIIEEVEPACEVPPREHHLSTPRADPFKSGNSTTSRSRLWTHFCSQAQQAKPSEPWLPPADNDPREDFTAIFMCHARLYKFSDRYECPELVELSLQKLRLTLSRYQFHQERASDVVDLIRYTYQHAMEFEEGRDKLKALVLDYAVCYVQQLSKEKSFLDLLEEPGSLASDLLVKMVGLFD